ncbi:MAG: hypothetical protein WKF91_19995 [Segetibacter sp.]
MEWKTLCAILTICLVAFFSKSIQRKATITQTISKPFEYINGGPRFKKLNGTFVYNYTVDKGKEIVLLFDSTNISRGDNYKFVEFLQVTPVLPVRYTFNVNINTAKNLVNRAVYRDFHVYDFKVVFELRKI